MWAAIGVQFSRCAIRLIAHCCGEVATEIDVLGRRSEDPLNFASLALIGPSIKRTEGLTSRGLRPATSRSRTSSSRCGRGEEPRDRTPRSSMCPTVPPYVYSPLFSHSLLLQN